MLQPSSLSIVHVVRQFHPGVGGMENFVEQLALRQLASGNRVTVVTLDRIFSDPDRRRLEHKDWHRGIEVVRLPFRGSQRYPVAPSVLGAIRHADLVHVHGVDFFCDYLAATVPVHRKPLLLTTHGGFFHTPFAATLKKLYFGSVTRASLSQYGAVIACSEEDQRRFAGICEPRLRLISNPVDVEKFAGLADRSSDTLIYFGRIAPNKEVGQLISWFAGLAETGERWRLIIAGKPMGCDLGDLRRQAERLGVSERIEIHETPSDEDLKGLIARSGLYCCASSYEGFGLAAVEGASAGLFPVLSQIPPFRRSVERLGFGTLVDFQDQTGWPASYAELDRSLTRFRQEVDAAGIKAAVEPFSWSAAIAAFDETYARVLGRERRRIGHVDVDVLDRTTATDLVLEAAAARRPLTVAFCNAHTVNLASCDPQLRNALQGAVVLNDGIGVDLASKLIFGSPFPDNLNGTDFIPHVLASAREPLRLFLLGGEEGVAEAAARTIQARYPGVEVAGTMHGFFNDAESPTIVRRISDSGANLVLVALGQPRQELWAARHGRDLPAPVLCVGALLDFLAERVPRAPEMIRKLRFEWAFRLANEPRRLASRYLLGNVSFLRRALGQKLAGPRI
jgi:alpha-1,3-mannosyltransferase